MSYTLTTPHEQSIDRMAYHGARDGYAADWHRFFAKTHRDLAIMQAAVKRAAADQASDERAHAKKSL